MAGLYPQLGTYNNAANSNPNLPFDWCEVVSQQGGTYKIDAGNSGMHATMEMYIRSEFLEVAIQNLIGFSQVIPCGDGIVPPFRRLKRNLPWAHPRIAGLFCTKITNVTGVQAKGKTSYPFGWMATDSLMKLSLEFTRPPYSVLGDNAIQPQARADGSLYYPEWNRFTDRVWTPKVEMLSRQQGTFNFIDAPSGAGGRGTPFPGSVGYPMGKMTLQRRWYNLPQNAVYNSNGLPTSLVENINVFGADSLGTCMATVNNDVFFGCPKGTLLYLAPEIIPVPLPIPADLMFLPGIVELYPLQFDVVFHFIYFDPPTGPTSATTAGAAGTMRGHNLVPRALDALWYPASVQATTKTILSSTASTPIKITTLLSHGYRDGDMVNVTGHGGNTNANGTWTVTVVDASSFYLDGSTNGGVGAGGNSIGGTPSLQFYDFTKFWQIVGR